MNTTSIELKNMFFDSICDYACGDLKLMLDTANYEGELQRLAVPIAQTCFSVLDVTGMLHRDGSFAALEKDTSLNIKKGLQLFVPSISQIQADNLVNFFRNGVMHTFLPHLGGKILNDKDANQILLQAGTSYEFNVHPLASQLISSLEGYRITYSECNHADFNMECLVEFRQRNLIRSGRIQYSQSTNSSGLTTTSLPFNR